MIKNLILALISLQIAQVWSATTSEKQICDSIKTKVVAGQNSYDICGNVIKEFAQYDAEIFSTMCGDVLMRMHSNIDKDTINYCQRQFKEVTHTTSSEGDDFVRQPVNSSGPLPTEQVTVASTAMDKCQEDDLSNFSCQLKSSIVLPDLNSIMNSPYFAAAGVSRKTPAVYTKEKCECFEKSVQKSFTFQKRVQFDIDLVMEKKRVNDLIFNAAGKKIINSFAANLEDINFYKTNNVQAIGGDQSANELQCNNMVDFKKVIMDVCNKNQIRADVIKGRADALLGAFGDFKNETTIEGKFKQLQEEVLNAQLDPSKIVPGGPKSYTRQEYDKSRFGIYQKRDEVKFMSELTDAVMDDPELSKIIEQELKDGKRPGHAIFKLVSDESNEKVTRLLSRLVQKHDNKPLYKNLAVALKTDNKEDLHNFMMSTYDLASDMHPGLKAIFRSPELFRRTHEQMEKRNGNQDLISELDRDPELLKTFFAKRCEGIKKQFSEALCYREENLINLANKEDLNKLLSEVTDQISPVMKDAILCRMPDTNKDPTSIFSKLSFNMGDKLSMADYFKRKVNVKGSGPASRFEKFAMEFTSGGNNSRYLSEMSGFRSDLRKPSAEYAAIDQASATQKSEISPTTSPIQPQTQILDKVAEKPLLSPSFSNNYAAPVSGTTDKDHPISPKDSKDPKSMLRDFLADEENKGEVERHLSNLSSKDQEELAKLKEEIAADKEKILALLQESERLKLKAYEEKVNIAEENLSQSQAISKSYNSQRDSITDDESEQTSGKISSSIKNSVGPENPSQTSASSSSSPSNVSNGRGTPGVQRSLASLNSSLSTATNNISAGNAGTSDRTEIVIQSSGSEDVSKEVISFVQKNEPDVETLKQLKNSGMTFRYKIIQNGVAVEKELKVNYASLSKEAKRFLEQKIALKEAKRNYSYNTLRLMLGLKAQKHL